MSDESAMLQLSAMLGYNLHRAASAVNHDLAAAFGDQGLRSVHLAILAALAERPGTSQRQLSRMLAIKPANMVAMVNELEGLGLIHRAGDPHDRRVHLLTLSPRATEQIGDLATRLRRHEARFLGELRPEDVATLRALLPRLWKDTDSDAA